MIETKHANLSTLAVTIQALHVSGKQMTLAVFRQLPRRMEEEESELWGVVRYEVKDEGSLWLVLSTAGKLYRRRLRPDIERHGYERDLERFGREAARLRSTLAREELHMPWEREIFLTELAEAEMQVRLVGEELNEEQIRGTADALLLSALPQLFIAV